MVERYQTARDVHYELRGLRSEVAAGTAELGGTPSASVDPVESTPVAEAPAAGAGTSSVRAAPEVPWIAVLPLKNQGADPDLESFADGLGDDITTGLSRFSFLHVVARHSALRVKDSGADMREIGAELGARYVLEGAVRKSGAAIRVNIQLLDAQTGTHIWAESFDRNLDESGIFDIQDAITDQVVATVADPYGMLARDLVAPIAGKAPEEMTPYEAVLRFFLYQQRITPEDHLVAREALERAVELDARYADAWAVLGVVLLDEYRHDFNPQPDPLDRALAAAQRAVDADPANQLANYSLAQIYFYRRDLGAFRASADRAINLNRRDGHTMAMIGILFGYSGDWERGVELTTAAMQLNPHHPGWYRFTTFFDHYRKGELEEALAVAQKINMPEYFPTHYCLAIANNALGNAEAAARARRDALRCWPEIEAGIENHLDMWWFSQPELKGRVLDELVDAGFRIPGR
jgi:adenylate cyclase